MPDPDAYRFLLQAKALLSFRIEPNMDAAIAKLEEAVSIDPQLIEAWETLAMARIEYVFSQGPDQTGSPNADPFQRHRAARQDANAALAIDPDSIDAQLALAILDHGDGSASKAETVRKVRALLARAPNHPGINFRLGMLMGGVGRFEEAARLFQRAMQLDPLRPLSAGLYADTLLSGGHEDEAIEFARSQGQFLAYQSTYTGLIMNLLKSDYQAARDAFTGLGPRHVFFNDGVYELPSVNLDSSNTQRLSGLIGRLIDVVEAGDPVTDPELPFKFLQAMEEGLLLPFYVAQFLAVGGYQDIALEMVSRLYDAGDQLVRDSGILLRPAFHAARQDPSIMQWLDRTGLRDYWVETGEWPDFCSDPSLTWDCETVASQAESM